MASRFVLPLQQVFSNLGAIGVGYKLKTYQTLTTTPLATYSDEGLTTPNSNPAAGATTGNQIADANGRFGAIWMGSEPNYKVVLTDANDVEIFSADPVNGGASSSLVNFDPMPEAFWGTTSGTSSAYTLASNVDISEVGYSPNQIFEVQFHTPCAPTPTLATDGLAALNLKKQTGTGTNIALLEGDVYGTHQIRNNGTDLIVLNPRTELGYRGTPPTLTVATNTLTLTNAASSYNVNTGSGAQTINTINGLASGQTAVIGISSNSNSATFTSGVGNVINPNGISLVLSSVNDKIEVYFDGTNAIVLNQWINKNFLASKAAKGYTYLPNGLLFQWGTTSVAGADSTVSDTFAITFPNAVYSVTYAPTAGTIAGQGSQGIQSLTTSGFDFYNGTDAPTAARWMAIGS